MTSTQFVPTDPFGVNDATPYLNIASSQTLAGEKSNSHDSIAETIGVGFKDVKKSAGSKSLHPAILMNPKLLERGSIVAQPMTSCSACIEMNSVSMK